MPEKPKEGKKSVVVAQIGSAGYRVMSATNYFEIEMNSMIQKTDCEALAAQGITVTVRAAK